MRGGSKKLVGAIAISLISLASVEGLVRVRERWILGNWRVQAAYYWDWSYLYEPHPETGYRLRPNARFELYHHWFNRGLQRISINSEGYRGPELRYPNPAGLRRVIALGSSTTFGYLLSDDATWPAQLQQLLRRNGEFEVVNAGVLGFTTQTSLLRMRKEIPALRPDVVIIYDAFNDIYAGHKAKGGLYSQAEYQPKRLSWIERFGENSLTFLKLRRAWKARLHAKELEHRKGESRLDSPLDSPVERYQSNLVQLANRIREIGAEPLFSTFATAFDVAAPEYKDAIVDDGWRYMIPGLSPHGFQEALVRYNATMRVVASRCAVTLVDQATRMPHDPRYFVDLIHTTPEGEKRMAEGFAPAVLEALRRRASERGVQCRES